MKYDLTKKMTKGEKRVLVAFSNTMLTLLSLKSFESITVNELCEKSEYPRATFYNYFDDKYDLLNYCWYRISSKISVEEYDALNSEQSLSVAFERAYDLADLQHKKIQGILKHNSIDSYLISSFRIYFANKLRAIFQLCPEGSYDIPNELVSDHYSNTLLLILEWCFLKEECCPKPQAYKYLKYLLQSL